MNNYKFKIALWRNGYCNESTIQSASSSEEAKRYGMEALELSEETDSVFVTVEQLFNIVNRDDEVIHTMPSYEQCLEEIAFLEGCDKNRGEYTPDIYTIVPAKEVE